MKVALANHVWYIMVYVVVVEHLWFLWLVLVGTTLGFDCNGLYNNMGWTVVSKISYKCVIWSFFVVIRCIDELDYVYIDIIYIQ